jgi:high-affinity nickel-transport protein
MMNHAARLPKTMSFRLLSSLILANLLVWGAAILCFHSHPLLLGTAFLAYSFGLRHAVDADHIAAIDNVTRKLLQDGKRPVAAGLFFSLGHSTVVVALSAAVALTAVSIKTNFSALASFGGTAGTLISATFLFAIAAMNFSVLRTTWQSFRNSRDKTPPLLPPMGGLLSRIFRRLFTLVRHSWQMYPIGLLFGLGFDTATEVGLLGISATEATHGLPAWSIMIFPAVFTAGMSLVDTADGIFMLHAYDWAFLTPQRKYLYNIGITSLSVAVALLVGSIEMLGLLHSPTPFGSGLDLINNNFEFFGYGIVAIFALSWLCSVLLQRRKKTSASF